MLFVFGREVERFIGRRAYIALYLVLLVAPAVVLDDLGTLAAFSAVPCFRFISVALWNFRCLRHYLSAR